MTEVEGDVHEFLFSLVEIWNIWPSAALAPSQHSSSVCLYCTLFISNGAFHLHYSTQLEF